MNASDRHASRQATDKQSSLIKRPCPGASAALAGDNTAGKQPIGPIGTARAIYTYIPSGASSPAMCWGGKRNSAARTSDSLSLNQAANIIEAAQFAAAIGLPFNRHVTIHWEQAGVPDCKAAWATGRFLKLAGDWLAKRGGRFAWAWVRENGEGKGSHVHILLHLPANKITGKKRARLGDMQRRWLRSITGATYRARTIRTARIGGTAGAAQTAPAVHQANLAAVVGYILKGASPMASQELGLERIEASGGIIGKRAATSQNIGSTARTAVRIG